MKSKIIYTITAICILGICISLYQLDNGNRKVRVHQHRDTRWQETKVKNNAESQTHLPIIKIDTHGQKVPGTPLVKNEEVRSYETAENGERTIRSSFDVIDLQKGVNRISDKPTLSSLAQISYRGNSSRHFDKKSYSVHLVQEDGTENKKEIAGMAAHDEWVLNGPYLDRSLLRDYLGMNISGEIMEYAPNVRYCELFVNGKYQGLYLLMETASKGEGRINIQKPDKKSSITSYIVRWDRAGKGDNELDNYAYYTFHSDQSALDVCYPGLNQLTDGRKEYIRNDISKLERVLYSQDMSDENKGYTQYIDVNAFADYLIINEFFRNVDAGQFSTYYYKEPRGKLKPCVWDFNNMCDNYMEQAYNKGGFDIINTPLFDALIKDKEFVTIVVDKYRKLRRGVLNESYLLNYIDETNAWLGEEVSRNDEVWGNVFDLSKYNYFNYLTPVERNLKSHKEAVEQLKSFIVDRGDWMDQHIDTLYQYCQNSKNANELIK